MGIGVGRRAIVALAATGIGLTTLLPVAALASPTAATTIRPRPDWAAGANQAAALFGYSVATAGDVNGDGFDDAVIGACCFASPEHNEGRAFVYHGGPGGLERTPRWKAEGNEPFGYFGDSVGTAGDVNGDGYDDVIVGAWGADRVSVFHGSSAGLRPMPTWVAHVEGVYFGDSVGTAGDINGDGYDDVIVGAPHLGPNFIGGAFVFFGSPTGLDHSPDWTVRGPGGIDYFGQQVSGAGDVNGDGYADVIVGAPNGDAGEGDEGRAYLYLGSPSGPSLRPDWVRSGPAPFGHFGDSVGPAGDVNADGFGDVAVGARFHPGGGRAYVFHGSPAGPSAEPDWAVNGSQPGEELGHSVRTAGDLDADGYDDLLVGSPWFTGGQSNEGRVQAFYGSPAGLGATPRWAAQSDAAGLLYCTCFGFSVGTAGDVNGDGRSDALVGAPYFTLRDQEEGVAVVYLGRP